MKNRQRPDSTRNRSGRRLFFGWYVVIASFLIGFFISGIVIDGFTSLFEPIRSTFGWSYAQVSLAPSLQGVLLGATIPFMGMIIDRWGARRLIFSGVIAICAGFFLLNRTQSLAVFYISFVLISLGYSTCAFSALTSTLVHWFHRKASLAIGISLSGNALGGLLVPVITTLTDSLGWRTAVFVLASTMFIVLLPLTLLLRRRPEDYGYFPDGDAAAPYSNPSVKVDPPPEHRLRLMFKSRTFWLIIIGFFLQFIAINATMVHIMPYLDTIGMGRSEASFIASAVSVTCIVGTLGFGWLGDRHNKRNLTLVTFLGMTFSMLSLGLSAEYRWLLIAFIAFFALGLGGGVTIISALANEHFGKNMFGTVGGFIFGTAQFGGALGAWLAGWIFDSWDTYRITWFAFSGVAFIGALFIAGVRTKKTKRTGPNLATEK